MTKVSMTTEDASKKTSTVQLVKLERGFKLAEQWVNNMSKSLEDDQSNGAILESRPPRLGIGATVPRESKYVRANDPIERKLRATLNAKERKFDAKANDARVEEDEEDEEEELESKTKAFTKKRPSLLPSSLNRMKKRK
ncbi:unnamed protein product [Cuscuta epithymum]|uniref:Uncharacterized protein n=1 Tax=Cuscuta epithymum TaxID=186058 RepID=A0AAV0CTH8_9ASTE|nr:unnamed protein product [Cuscuta epithymum]